MPHEFIDPRENKKSLIQRQIDATHNQIDQLVYEIYGLTDFFQLERGTFQQESPCPRDPLDIIRDDRNRVDTRRFSTYYVVELHNNHC